VTAINAGVVTGKLQQMASGFVYDTRKTASETPGKFDSTQTAVWFSSHKFDRLEELLDENQHANTIIVYQYQEELAEIKRRFTVTTLDDVEQLNAGTMESQATRSPSKVSRSRAQPSVWGLSHGVFVLAVEFGTVRTDRWPFAPLRPSTRCVGLRDDDQQDY
jgi:hypothetical protein